MCLFCHKLNNKPYAPSHRTKNCIELHIYSNFYGGCKRHFGKKGGLHANNGYERSWWICDDKKCKCSER